MTAAGEQQVGYRTYCTADNVSESERAMGGRPVPAQSDEVGVIVTILDPAVSLSAEAHSLFRQQRPCDGSALPDDKHSQPIAFTETCSMKEPLGIKNGIEFYKIGDIEDVQCARCGSSCFRRDCDNCGGEGIIEADEDDWQDFDSDRHCEWCHGEGGWWRCLSSKDYCEAHPNPGREDQPVMGCEAHEYED